jgi:hypothetical protein
MIRRMKKQTLFSAPGILAILLLASTNTPLQAFADSSVRSGPQGPFVPWAGNFTLSTELAPGVTNAVTLYSDGLVLLKEVSPFGTLRCHGQANRIQDTLSLLLECPTSGEFEMELALPAVLAPTQKIEVRSSLFGNAPVKMTVTYTPFDAIESTCQTMRVENENSAELVKFSKLHPRNSPKTRLRAESALKTDVLFKLLNVGCTMKHITQTWVGVGGSKFLVATSNDDKCDGGNSYGVILAEDLSTVVAHVYDGDITCKAGFRPEEIFTPEE